MVTARTWFRYVYQKLDHAVSVSNKSYQEGIITDKQKSDVLWKNFFQGTLTFTHWNKKGEEMVPAIFPEPSSLLVRKIPTADSKRVVIGDVLLFKDPIESGNFLVRRLAAVEGDMMISTCYKEAPFDLEKDECWILADNESIKPEDAYDSRDFGPVSMSSIVGRVIYCLKNAVDHGTINNSVESKLKDRPVLEVELDVYEMYVNHENHKE
ncbi:hypothetical protein Leryth_017460 [Lithospermum erythrorhizon]|nr:hypothetical protein Leryth_017460 [Lithospermum erythrorhizon]